MRYLKLYESFDKEDIDSICKEYRLSNYTINEDGSIDVDGVVNMSYHMNPAFINTDVFTFKILPLKFRNVSGSFFCNGSGKLVTLEGCPESIKRDFICSVNKLTSLVGGPKYVGGKYHCGYNKIRTLEGFPINLGGDFYCEDNPIYEFWKLFRDKDKIELFNDFGITDGEVVIIDRLNEFLEIIGKPMVKSTKVLEKEGYKII